MKPKLLVLASTFPRHDKDREPRFIADLCSELTAAFDITVLTQHRPGTAAQETKNGYEVFRFRYAPESLELLSENGGFTASLKKNRFLWLLVPFFLLSQILSIRKHLKSKNYSAIHAHWLIPQGLAAVMANKTIVRSVPIVCTGHGADIFGLRGNLLNQIKRWVINHSAAVSVVSQSMKEYLESKIRIDPEKISVIPMGTDLTGVFVPGDIDRVPGQIAFVGRLVEKKGVKHLIQIIPSLASEVENLRLIIAGIGPEQETLEKQVKDLCAEEYVDFVGSQDHVNIARLFASSQVCVFPFVQASDGDMEGFGLVIVEAMGCKCPAVVGDVPAIRDIVLDEETGFICDPRNKEQLKAKIVKLVRSKELRDLITRNAHIHAHRHFSWEVIGQHYIEILGFISSPQ